MKVNTIFKDRNVKFLVAILAAWTILMLSLSNRFGEDNMIYAIGEIHTFDSSLFNNNVYMGAREISPRYVVDFLFGILMKINGGSWADAALVWTYFGVAVQSVAIASLARKIDDEHPEILSAVFTYIILYAGNYDAGGFSLVAVASTSIGPALAFAILAISFVVGEEKHYTTAWILAAIATLCHIHEGIYCCAVIFILALADCIVHKKLLLKENGAILVPILAMVAVVAPSLATDTMNISNEEFVYIYSFVRHPHHLVPSTWELESIAKTVFTNITLMLLAMAVTYLFKRQKIKRYLYEMLFLNLAWVAALFLMYYFTEKKPVAFISTLFLSKAFKYVYLIAVVWLLKAISDLRKQRCILSGYLFLLFACISPSLTSQKIVVAFLIITAVLLAENFKFKKYKIFFQKYSLFTDILFFVLVVGVKLNSVGTYNSEIICCVLFVILCTRGMHKIHFSGYKVVSTVMCACLFLLSLYSKGFVVNHGTLELVDGDKVLQNSLGIELYDLAEKFKGNTDKEEEFLADPDVSEETGWFQVASERNCYVVQKVIPSSKSRVYDWYERYMQTKDFKEKSGEEIKNIMAGVGIQYVLVNSDMYDTIEQTQSFSVFEESMNDAYRIYKLN